MKNGDVFMFFKKFKKVTRLFLLSLVIMPTIAYAYSKSIIAGGQNIGIEIKTKGVVVVGTYETGNYNPGEDAGIKTGDIITSIDDKEVDSIDEMINTIHNLASDSIKIGYIRDSVTNYTNLKLYKDNDTYKTGLYVKDTISGIGTLTFIDPNTKLYGALGHEITEKNTGKILEIKDGKIYASTVTDIEPSKNGIPGEKNAKLNKEQAFGDIFENTNKGIFGDYHEEINDAKLYKVANFEDIKKGEAKILTVLDNDNIEEFVINILKVNNSQKTKNIVFEITDENLLQQTGGIVQGMSGSPIIQGEYIIGAVTHVVVDSPSKGYGILITNMLEEAEN